MKTRIHDWFDTKRNRVMYGFQVHTADGWKNVAEDGKPCIYTCPEQRDAKRAEYRRRKAIRNTNFSAN
ncbi:hypothetical protein [Lysobacter brunescens]|uniref:Uncharacterized protein n=1 Tax=Lysobacter brunescens TaxID=262323 RepID=A0ABW2YF47_9GAMM